MVAFGVKYFSGNEPSIVAVTLPPCVCRGVGVTWKLSDDNAPNLDEHDDKAIREQTEIDSIRLLCITVRILIKVPRTGLEPVQPFLAKGF